MKTLDNADTNGMMIVSRDKSAKRSRQKQNFGLALDK
jgi:hypothetical protein